MKKIPNILLFILFFAGILLGLTLTILSTWADFESTVYGFTKQTGAPFQGLSCPVMMTTNETSNISIRIVNKTGKPISPSIKTEISTRLMPDSTLEFIELAPREETLLQKTISAENIDFDQFIFAKVSIYSAYPMEDQANTCGVFILHMRGNGTAILIGMTILSLLLTGGSLYFLHKNGLTSKHLNPLLAIAVFILPALLFSFLGWWIQATLFIVLVILMLVITIGILIR